MNYFMWSVLCLSAVQIVLSQQEIGKQCYTSEGTQGICKPQSECLASQNSPSDSEVFSETCHIETDGTPIVCCVLKSEEKESTSNSVQNETTKNEESSTTSNSNENQQKGDDEIETRFYSGPRKKQYTPYKSVYKTPTSNLIPHYDPILYNNINPTSTYPKKTNQYNNIQNGNNNYAFQPSVFKGDQRPSNYDNVNSYYPSVTQNQNYNPYASQSNNGFSNQNSNYNPSNQNSNYKPSNQNSNYNPSNQNSNYNPSNQNSNYNPSNQNSNYNPSNQNSNYNPSNQNSNYNPLYQNSNSVNRPVRPSDGTIVFKPINRPNGSNNYRPTSSTNRPDLETNYWPTQSTRVPDPVWSQVSESTSRTVRKPKPTESSGYTSTSRNNQQSSLGQQKRISEQKCLEYAKIVTQSVSAVPLSINSQATTVEVQDCPNSAVELIVGGSKAALGEFPHMAALGFRRGSSIEYYCGGTLISEEFILTAAHCIKSALGDPIHVRLGDLNLEKENDGAQPQIIGIQEIFVHPRYNPQQLYNDIALIRMSRRIYFNKMLRPACLYPAFDIKAQKAIATGWGSTNYGETSSDDLLKVVLNIIDNKQCSSFYVMDTKLKNGITNDMICAGELQGKKDTCQGDSGGPLQITSPNHKCLYYVVGVTSFGKSCGLENSAGIYTRVSQYIDWIEGIVWKN